MIQKDFFDSIGTNAKFRDVRYTAAIARADIERLRQILKRPLLMASSSFGPLLAAGWTKINLETTAPAARVKERSI
jgi:hypothetical protein